MNDCKADNEREKKTQDPMGRSVKLPEQQQDRKWCKDGGKK